MVAGRWSLVAGRRSIGAGRPSLGRHITSRGTSVAYTFKRFCVVNGSVFACRGSRFHRSGATLTIVARNVCYVDVRAVWHVFHVVSSIRADTVSDEQPNVDRLRLYKIEGRLCVPPRGRPTIVARNVYYVDVRAVWRVSRVVHGIRTDTVSDEQPCLDCMR